MLRININACAVIESPIAEIYLGFAVIHIFVFQKHKHSSELMMNSLTRQLDDREKLRRSPIVCRCHQHTSFMLGRCLPL